MRGPGRRSIVLRLRERWWERTEILSGTLGGRFFVHRKTSGFYSKIFLRHFGVNPIQGQGLHPGSRIEDDWLPRGEKASQRPKWPPATATARRRKGKANRKPIPEQALSSDSKK